MKKENNLNYPKSAVMGVVSKGLKNEFETAVVNEPSVFEPLKFYCSYLLLTVPRWYLWLFTVVPVYICGMLAMWPPLQLTALLPLMFYNKKIRK